MSRIRVERALMSVYDKTGLVELAAALAAAGVEIVASGGTARALAAADLAVTPVAEVTGFPEVLGGRVKSLHPRIHAGLLADPARPEHRAELEAHGIAPFQLVVANLYPFAETAAAPDATEADIIEQIDIGGPAMIRAAAKNHAAVAVVTDPARYPEITEAVRGGGTDAELRRRLAQEAFYHTAAYDAAIVAWLEDDGSGQPERLVVALRREQLLRYGENPHQAAAVYAEEGTSGWWRQAELRQGKPLSFNNLVDGEAAWRLVNCFEQPAAAVVKHTNPCGVAVADGTQAALRSAWECDPLSAFGGVVALNRQLDEASAKELAEVFVEVIVAPAASDGALAVLVAKPNLRVLTAPPPTDLGPDMARLDGGLALQQRDQIEPDSAWTVAGSRSPTPAEWQELRFAWTVAAHTKSNAIVVSRGGAAVGVGAGDQSRVGAARRAIERAGDRAQGGVAASDAFFPFRDGLDVLASAGVTAVVQPGGSRRDDEVISAADEHGMALVHTGYRHFRH